MHTDWFVAIKMLPNSNSYTEYEKKLKISAKNSLCFLRYFIKFHLFDGGGGSSLSCNYVEFFGCSVFGWIPIELVN